MTYCLLHGLNKYMNLIQILLVLFFLYALSKVLRRYRSHELTAPLAGGWTLFWCLAIVAALVPNSTAWVAKVVGVGRGADLVVYVALAVLFYSLFRLTARVEKLNRDLTRLTRELALREGTRTKDQGTHL